MFGRVLNFHCKGRVDSVLQEPNRPKGFGIAGTESTERILYCRYRIDRKDSVLQVQNRPNWPKGVAISWFLMSLGGRGAPGNNQDGCLGAIDVLMRGAGMQVGALLHRLVPTEAPYIRALQHYQAPDAAADAAAI
jgi:hypothetical protein